MSKLFIPFCSFALALTIAGCSDTKTAKETATAETAGTETAAQVEGTKTITLANGATVTWIQDNDGDKLMPRTLFSDASDSLYNSLNMPDGIPASVSTFLVQVDGKYILFDAGLGFWGGQLKNRLAALGVNADSISAVYLTHFDLNHIAGLLEMEDLSNDDNRKAFKNAAIYASKVEYDYWMKEFQTEKPKPSAIVMSVYKDSLHLFAFGDTLPPRRARDGRRRAYAGPHRLPASEPAYRRRPSARLRPAEGPSRNQFQLRHGQAEICREPHAHHAIRPRQQTPDGRHAPAPSGICGIRALPLSHNLTKIVQIYKKTAAVSYGQNFFWGVPLPTARAGYIARRPVRTCGTPAPLLQRRHSAAPRGHYP